MLKYSKPAAPRVLMDCMCVKGPSVSVAATHSRTFHRNTGVNLITHSYIKAKLKHHTQWCTCHLRRMKTGYTHLQCQKAVRVGRTHDAFQGLVHGPCSEPPSRAEKFRPMPCSRYFLVDSQMHYSCIALLRRSINQ